MPPDQPLQQKLVAILHADVAGYSRLSGADELGTHRTLRNCLDAIEDLIKHYSGRVANHAGDAVLAEFDRVTNALACAIAIQRSMAACNQGVVADRQVQFRIGINLGEVIVDREDIFGDGVNVAARLDALAEPGAVFVSGAVYDAIGTKLPLNYEYLGEQQFKNIERPVRTYRVTVREGVELPAPADIANGRAKQRRSLRHFGIPTLLLAGLVSAGMLVWLGPWQARNRTDEALRTETAPQGKPSIAVMAFDNISGDTQQDYFSDGISDDIITDLSQVSSLRVIARNSSFSYKGKPVNVQKIGKELGVQYVLEGSIRKSSDQVRINAQLVSTGDGHHLWAERYDRRLSDIFQLQDEITQKIVAALLIKLTGNEREMLAQKTTRNFEAYDLFLQGQEYYRRTTREDNLAARELFRKAIELDPGFSRAYGAYAVVLARAASVGWDDKPNETLDHALELARESVRLSPSVPQTNWALGFVYMHRQQYEGALEVMGRLVALAPNYADGYGLLALIKNRLGRAQEAIEHIHTAIALNPFYTWEYPWNLGRAYYTLKRYDEAERFLKEALTRNESAPEPRLFLAASYVGLGRLEDAKWEINELIMSNPGMTFTRLAGSGVIANKESLARFLADLRKAGLPE